jgi:hypothetical protein
MLKKIILRVELLGLFIYICAMNNLINFMINKKYDLLSLGCMFLMFFVNVLFALPAIIFLVIGESKKIL